jgi:hypothetical protein
MFGPVQVGSEPRVDHCTYLPETGLYIIATRGAMRFGKLRLALPIARQILMRMPTFVSPLMTDRSQRRSS